MKKNFTVFLVILFLCIVPCLTAQDISIDEIHERYRETVLLPNISATLTVQLISARGESREIRAQAFQQSSTETESEAKRLFVFEYPPNVRNTGILIESFADTEKSTMWMYLPAIKKLKRIALSTSGGGYFMGSDFSYSDFIPKSRDDFTHDYLGEVTVDGNACYAVRENTITDTQRQNLKLSYQVNYYRKSDFVMVARDYYDLAGELLKEYRVKEVMELDGQYLYPTKIEMRNVQTGHSSILTMSDINTDPIPASYFTPRYLEKR